MHASFRTHYWQFILFYQNLDNATSQFLSTRLREKNEAYDDKTRHIGNKKVSNASQTKKRYHPHLSRTNFVNNGDHNAATCIKIKNLKKHANEIKHDEVVENNDNMELMTSQQSEYPNNHRSWHIPISNHEHTSFDQIRQVGILKMMPRFSTQPSSPSSKIYSNDTVGNRNWLTSTVYYCHWAIYVQFKEAQTKLNTGLIWSHIHSLLLLDTTSITMIYEVVNKNKTIAIFQIKPQIFHTESINTKKEMWVMWKGKYSMVKAVFLTCVFAMLLYLFSNCVIIAYKIDTFKSKVSTLNIFASKTFL